MKTNFAKVWVVVFLGVMLGACGGAQKGGLSSEQYNAAPLTVPIPQGLDNTAVIEAAEKALLGRKWRIVSKSGDEVVGNLMHRSWDATVTIRIEGDRAVLYSDAMFDGPHEEGPIPGVPSSWLNNIQRDMVENLSS